MVRRRSIRDYIQMAAPVREEPIQPAAAGGARRALRWLLGLYVLSAVVVAIQRTIFSQENNFLIFRAAFRHLMAGSDLYAAYPAMHADFFKYSPTFALGFAPYALFPLTPGYLLWALTGSLTLFAGVTRLLPARQAALTLALTWLAVFGSMQRAQSNVLCAGLMILAFVALERDRPWRAAAAVAAGTFVKIFPLAAVTFACFHPRKSRFAAVFVVSALAGLALPLLFVTPASLAMQYRSWFAIEARDADALARVGTGGADLYGGLMGLIRVWGHVDWPAWPTQVAGTLILLLPLARALARRETGRFFRLQFLASTLVFCVLFNHQAESPSYSIAIIGTALWFAVSEQAPWRAALMAASIIIINLASTDLMPRLWYQRFYVPYLVKTVPLVPVWIAMQGELLGLIGNRGRSEGVERDQGEVGAAKALEQAG